MGVASGCGEQEVGVASGSGWNLWVWLLGVVLRRYIDFLILLIPTPLVSVLFGSSIPTSFFILLLNIILPKTIFSDGFSLQWLYEQINKKNTKIALCPGCVL